MWHAVSILVAFAAGCGSDPAPAKLAAVDDGGGELDSVTLPCPDPARRAVRPANNNAPIERRERLGGLLNFYYRHAA
jgi:hypothetical protein